MMDQRFLRRLDAPLICKTAAILGHSLQCWQTGNLIANGTSILASSKGKTNNADLRFSELSGSLGAQALSPLDTLENRTYLKG